MTPASAQTLAAESTHAGIYVQYKNPTNAPLSCAQDDQKVYMVTELCEGGDLEQYLKVRPMEVRLLGADCGLRAVVLLHEPLVLRLQ